jgi:receptor protein-tyrosine kinase
MLIPKASHLVERVAERLLRSGALDASAAQLLRQPDTGPSADVTVDGVMNESLRGATMLHDDGPVESARRSSLFAPPPSAAVVRTAIAAATLAQTLPDTPEDDHEPLNPQTTDISGFAVDTARAPLPLLGTPVSGPVLPSPAIPGQVRSLGASAIQPTVMDRPADFATSDAATATRGWATDPAASPLQGPLSVDAVSLERAGMVDWSRTRTRISEEFRLVQRQIIRSAFGPGAEPGFSNLLLVTSARPGEGKSFMSTNLSGSIARQGDHHVLLVDADSKRDSICYSLGLAQARGLLDLAANPKLDPSPLIVKTPIERLSILPVGRERERSAELFSTKEMTRLIQSLGRRYADRLLILDAPPCLSTSDPAVLAQVVGQILFVVEADRTQRDEIEASLDLIQACPTITMVLNKQQISSRYTFGAYSSYYSS